MRRTASIPLLTLVLMLMAGCEKDPASMSDTELGLNAQQTQGRRVFNVHCLICHPAYSTQGNKGPGLKGLYKKEFLPSGLTATDEHVEQTIIGGRTMMPQFGDQLSQQQIADLIAYLRTL